MRGSGPAFWRATSRNSARRNGVSRSYSKPCRRESDLSYYDCVVNAIVKSDEVVGASILASDITEQREKERRFTQLFETLQEGVRSELLRLRGERHRKER